MFPTTNADAVRKPSFQSKLTSSDGHRNRLETTVQLRKSRREEMIMKRRAFGRSLANTVTNDAAGLVDTNTGDATKIVDQNATIGRLMDTLKAWEFNRAGSVDLGIMTNLVRDTRRMLSSEEDFDPPVSKLLQMGAHHYLIKVIERESDPKLLFEVAWVFTNMLASTKKAHHDAIWNSGAIHQLARLCLHDSPNVREQAAWCIGNMAADSPSRRDAVFGIEAVIHGIHRNLEDPHNPSLLNTYAFTSSNLVKGGTWTQKRRLFPLLTRCLKQGVSRRWTAPYLKEMAWAVSYCTECIENEQLQLVMNSGISETLVDVLSTTYADSRELQSACLRTLGNFAAGSDAQTTEVVNAGFLKVAPNLLQSRYRGIRRETCWTLSNIATGSQVQVHSLVMMREAMNDMIRLASQGPHDVVREALYCLVNIVENGSAKDAHLMVRRGIFEPFCFFMKRFGEPRLTVDVLGSVKKLFEYNEQMDLGYINLFQELHGIEHLERLQDHANENVYKTAVYLLDTFFGANDEEDQNVAPAASDSTFEFGVDLPSKQLFPSEESGASTPLRYSFGGDAVMNTGN